MVEPTSSRRSSGRSFLPRTRHAAQRRGVVVDSNKKRKSTSSAGIQDDAASNKRSDHTSTTNTNTNTSTSTNNFPSSADLRALLVQFFKPVKRDSRGTTSIGVIGGPTTVGAAETEESNGEDDEIEEIDTHAAINGSGGGDVSVATSHVSEIQQADTDEELPIDNESNTESVVEGAVEMEYFFEEGSVDEAFKEFRALLGSEDIECVGNHCHRLVQLLQLGKLEKGAVTASSKYNSRNGRWFNQKANSGSGDNPSIGDDGESDEDFFIQRDSLVCLKCKRGRSECVENYRVLGFFTKYYNKWFVSTEERFAWKNNQSTVQNVRFLARLVKESGSIYKEVDLKAGGDWSPYQVFCLKHFSDIIEVKNALIDM